MIGSFPPLPPRVWKGFAIMAALCTGLALLAVFQPHITAVAISVALAFSLFIAGIRALLAAATTTRAGQRLTALLIGIAAMASSALLVLNPIDGAISLVVVIGAYLAATGILELVRAIRSRLYRRLHLMLGLIDLTIGLLILFLIPRDAIQVLAVLASLSFLTRAVAFSFIAVVLRRVRRF